MSEQIAESERQTFNPRPLIHAYYLRQGYESCPTCGEWLVPNDSSGPDS